LLNSSLFTSNKEDWETPDKLFRMLDDEFHFTLDVCANEVNHKTPDYMNKEFDALQKDWYGICWMNPPYGKNISKWVKKAYESGKTVVCLLPVRSDTKWWQEYCMNGEVRLIDKRLKFKGSNNMATFPSAIVIFGKDAKIGKLLSYKYK
jgi:phage N-6-adenine-methyltransferase